jgi:hypothetical protein
VAEQGSAGTLLISEATPIEATSLRTVSSCESVLVLSEDVILALSRTDGSSDFDGKHFVPRCPFPSLPAGTYKTTFCSTGFASRLGDCDPPAREKLSWLSLMEGMPRRPCKNFRQSRMSSTRKMPASSSASNNRAIPSSRSCRVPVGP